MEKISAFVKNEINPFYQKLCNKLNINFILFSGIISTILFLFHFAVSIYSKVNIYEDFSYFLIILIFVVLISVFIATKYLKIFVINLYPILLIDEDTFIRDYCIELKNKCTDFRLLPYGLVFGIINVLLGHTFGIWYNAILITISYSMLLFFAGFTCGIAIGGIVSILQIISNINNNDRYLLDFFNADNCGGTSPIGKILFTFAILTLIAGFFVAVYIYNTPWTNTENNLFQSRFYFISLLRYIWIFFPFTASILVFIYPVLKLHRLLKKYRSDQITLLRTKMKSISQIVISNVIVTDAINESQINCYIQVENSLKKYEELLLKMNTFPYSISLQITYFSTLFTLITTILNIVFELLEVKIK